jgi:hypothetical protein
MPFLSECRGSVAFYTPIKKLHQQNIFNYRHLTPVKLMAFSYWEGIYLRGRVNRRKMKKGKEKRGKRISQKKDLASDTTPAFQKDDFICSLCGVYAKQVWHYASSGTGTQLVGSKDTHTYLVECWHCKGFSIWHKEQMIYPSGGPAPLPYPDLPDDIKEDYEEARSIVSRSPRSAAALLRLAVDKLLDWIIKEKKLEGNKKDINAKIKLLVENGLRPELQKAFDSVRIVGNHSVHPGQIDLNDNPEIAIKLFTLVNIIARQMITEPNDIRDFYDKLPEAEKKNVERRNGNKAT